MWKTRPVIVVSYKNTLHGPSLVALISTTTFTFARIGAILGTKAEDYYHNCRCWIVRLHEKGGESHDVVAHHTLRNDLDTHIKAAGIAGDPKCPPPPLSQSQKPEVDRPAAPPQQCLRYGRVPGHRRRLSTL
jgi:hypothetical protein